MKKLGKTMAVAAGAAALTLVVLPGIASAQSSSQFVDQSSSQNHGQSSSQMYGQSSSQVTSGSGQFIGITPATGQSSDSAVISEAILAGGVVSLAVAAGGILVMRRRASAKA